MLHILTCFIFFPSFSAAVISSSALKTVLSMAHLKWMMFFSLCLLTLASMTWYRYKGNPKPKMVPPTAEIPTDPMYFYRHRPFYKQNFIFTLRERLKCEDYDTFLVILVTSRPAEVRARQAIRISWGSKKSWWGKQVRILFLLGQPKERENSSLSIKEESILYGDIIQQDFLDTYYNLTLKTIMAFRWVTEFCPNAQYVMKTDSDVFINIGNLVKYLVDFKATENFFTGFPMIEARCYRDVNSKAYVSREEYPFDIFPPYCSGLGYILDVRLAVRIYAMMAHVKLIKFEDVYVGICLSILRVGVTFPKDTELFMLQKIQFDFCKFKHLIATHRVTPDEMVMYWYVLRRSISFPCA